MCGHIHQMLRIESLSKVYPTAHGPLTVLNNANLEIRPGSSVAIIGPSGSGKTTLLSLLAGLDTPSEGSVHWNELEISKMNESRRAELRLSQIGFVFQSFQLVPTLTALENVCIPLELQRSTDIKSRAHAWLESVGLAEREDHYPSQLSGGEQQRVAIARAMVGNPKFVFADEPTGNLDEETGLHIEDLLFETHRKLNNTLIIVTHNLELAERADTVVRLRSGKMVENNDTQPVA